jgi:hypothetical protein
MMVRAAVTAVTVAAMLLAAPAAASLRVGARICGRQSRCRTTTTTTTTTTVAAVAAAATKPTGAPEVARAPILQAAPTWTRGLRSTIRGSAKCGGARGRFAGTHRSPPLLAPQAQEPARRGERRTRTKN